MAHDPFGQTAGLDQRLDVEPGGDAHLFAQQSEFFGGDVAGRTRLSGERAAAEPGHRRVEGCHPKPQTLIGAGDALAPGIMQMQRDPQIVPALSLIHI